MKTTLSELSLADLIALKESYLNKDWSGLKINLSSFNSVCVEIDERILSIDFTKILDDEPDCNVTKLKHNKSIFHLGQCQWCYSNKIK